MTEQNRTDLTAQVASLLPDNTTKQISAADQRTVAGDNVDSNVNIISENFNDFQNSHSSGLLKGGAVSINGGDNTKFDFTALILHIVDNFTDPENPVITKVEITAQTAITGTEVVTDNITFIGIRLDNVAPTGGTATAVTAIIDDVPAGTVYITQKPTEYTRTEVREIVQIGVIIHSGSVIDQAFFLQQKILSIGLQLFDLAFAIGVINVSGNEFSANGANLSIDKSAGEIFRQGSNLDGTVAGLKNPNITITVATSPTTFKYIHRDGSGGFTVLAFTTVIDPDQFDDGSGTLAAVSNNKFTIKKMYVATNNIIRVEYGQVEYGSLAEAEEAVTVATVSSPTLIAEAAFRGWLIVKKGITDLTASISAGDAKFMGAGKFSQGPSGSSITGEINTVSNVGAGGQPLFKQKVGVNFEFRNLQAGTGGITLSLDGGNNEIDINFNLAATRVYTAQQNFALTGLTDQANISWDLDVEQVASVILDGNRTLDNPTNQVAGGRYTLIVEQDGVTGSRTLAYGTAYLFPGGTAPVLSTGVGDIDKIEFISDGTNMLGTFALDFS